MRILLLLSLLTLSAMADETIEFFKKDLENKVLCHVGQYTYKVLSQKNAKLIKIHAHFYFKLNNENNYFLTTGCQKISTKKEGIIF